MLDPTVHMIEEMKAVRPAFRKQTDEAFDVWQARARARLMERLGLPIPKAEPNLRIEWTRTLENGVEETRFLFDSEKDVTVSCHLLVPVHEPGKRLPLIICLQGHSTGMHISLGRPKYPGDEQSISGGDRDFARQVVARGQAALVMDQRGFGERGGTEKGPACHQPAVQAMLLGRTLIGQRCHDISCAIDVIEAHFPQIDASRIAIMGNSGGGTATIYAAAVETRIAAAMPSCAFCGYLPSIGAQHHCLCNYIPGIMLDFDMGDLAGLIAPRPLVVVSGKDDGIFPLSSAKEQMEIARGLYEAADASDAVRHVIGQQGHRFYAAQAWPVFDELTGWKGEA